MSAEGAMVLKRIFAVIGGDRRQRELAKLLVRDGHSVITCLTGLEGDLPPETIAQAEAVVLPLPLSKERGLLHAAERMELETLWSLLRPEQILFGGQIQAEEHGAAAAHGLRLEDYFLREELTVANAVPTALGKGHRAWEEDGT